MGDPFVTPAVQRLTLSTGDTIDIIKRLNHGETEDMYARFLEKRGSVRTVLILTYLVGWSLTRDGQPVPYGPMVSEQERTDTIRNLDPDVAAEIHAAIEAHEATEDRKRSDAKKKDGWGTRIRGDLAIALHCGWTLRDVRALTVDEYDVVIAMLNDRREGD